MKEAITKYINEELLADEGEVEIDTDDELLTEGHVDSLGVMRLVSFIGAQFGIEVPPEDITIENFRSVDVLGNYLERRAATGQAPGLELS